MKMLDKKTYEAYQKYKELNAKESEIRKMKEEVKLLLEEGFGRAKAVVTPFGTTIKKQEIVRKIPARVDHFYVYREEVK